MQKNGKVEKTEQASKNTGKAVKLTQRQERLTAYARDKVMKNEGNTLGRED